MLEPVTFIAPLGTWKMDVEKSEFKSNDDGDEEDDDDNDDVDADGDDDETLRRGCCVKRLTRHMARVPFEGGGLWLSLWCDSSLGGSWTVDGHETGHSEQSRDIWIRKESTTRCPWLLTT